MIHEALVIAQVAKRYYIITRGRELSAEQARKNFYNDQKKDLKILKKVITDIFKEQKALLK